MTEIGTWEMKTTNTEDKVCTFRGLLCGGVTLGDIDLTYYLCEKISVDDLFIFDGCDGCDTEG